MGWTNQNVIAQLVLIQGANDALYVYSGTAALGNLIESITGNNANTTDSFGNTVLPFHALYDNTLHTAITFDGSQMAAYNSATAPPGPYTWTKTADILLNDQFVFNTDSAGQPVRFGAGANLLQYFRVFTSQLFVTAGATGPSTTQLVEVQGTAELEKVIISPTLAAAGTSAILEVQGAAAVTAGGLAVTGGTSTDTLTVTSTSTFDAKETITAGGLAVTGGTSTDTLTVTSTSDLKGAVTAENEILLDNISTPATPTGAAAVYGGSGHQKYVGSDGNAYNTGRISVSGAPGQTINTTSATNAITGSSTPVAAGTYVLDAIVWCTNGATGADQAGGVNGPSVSTMNVEIDLADNTAGSSLVMLGSGRLAAIGTRSGVSSGINSGIINGAHTFTMRMRGYLTFSAAGNFTLTASCVTSASDTFTVNAFEFGLWPVT